MHIVRDSKHYGIYEQEYLAWYERRFNNPGQPFDPRSLVKAVQEQYPDRPALASAFARCTREWARSELYTHFLSPQDVEARWKYAGGFMLQHPTLGALAVDTTHDPEAPEGFSIGGIEYLDLVMGRRVDVKKLQKAMHIAKAQGPGKDGRLPTMGRTMYTVPLKAPNKTALRQALGYKTKMQ